MGMNTIQVRTMRQDDILAVAEIEAACFSQPWSAQGFLDALKLADTVFLVAEEKGQLLGYAGMYTTLDEGEITNVAVSAAARCCGIGGKLIAELIKEAKSRSLTDIILEVRVSNAPAIHLYEKYGFSKQGVRKGFYEFPKEDAYIMRYGQ